VEGWQSSKQEQPTIDGSGEGVVAVDDDGGDGRTAAGNDNGRGQTTSARGQRSGRGMADEDKQTTTNHRQADEADLVGRMGGGLLLLRRQWEQQRRRLTLWFIAPMMSFKGPLLGVWYKNPCNKYNWWSIVVGVNIFRCRTRHEVITNNEQKDN
jgi:hypothetical protein